VVSIFSQQFSMVSLLHWSAFFGGQQFSVVTIIRLSAAALSAYFSRLAPVCMFTLPVFVNYFQ
jgi:hypothetical protein